MFELLIELIVRKRLGVATMFCPFGCVVMMSSKPIPSTLQFLGAQAQIYPLVYQLSQEGKHTTMIHNTNMKAQEQQRYKLPSMTLIFLLRCLEICNLLPNLCCSPTQEKLTRGPISLSSSLSIFWSNHYGPRSYKHMVTGTLKIQLV